MAVRTAGREGAGGRPEGYGFGRSGLVIALRGAEEGSASKEEILRRGGKTVAFLAEIAYNHGTVPGGELAVPCICNPLQQSLHAGLGFCREGSDPGKGRRSQGLMQLQTVNRVRVGIQQH